MKKINHFIFITIIFVLIIACEDEIKENEVIQNKNEITDAYNLIKDVPGIRSLVISQHQKILYEEYFNNTNSEPDSIIDIRSATKSVLSILVGIAIDKGYIESVDQPLSDFITPLVGNLDTTKGQIRIDQLLTMTCGLEWHELSEPSEFIDFVYAENQLLYVLEKPLINQPGTVFDYSDGAAHLISVILTQATGMSARDFAQMYLFDPLGIGDRFWYEDNQGYNYGGVGLCIGPHDMIKIGNLMLNNGTFNGNKVVSSEWINKSTLNHVSTNNVLPYLKNYGYYWWTGIQKGYSFYAAMGYGGQYIVVVPNLNLVVVATCNFTGIGGDTQAGENWNKITNIIMNQVISSFV